MRLWSLNPQLLDSKGLVACWREGLLALNVLGGKTRGYKNHPQLKRFEEHSEPIQALSNYLFTLSEEAKRRGYNFNENKITLPYVETNKIPLATGQLEYEFYFLRHKVINRSPKEWAWGDEFETLCYNTKIFKLFLGKIESWEKVKEF